MKPLHRIFLLAAITYVVFFFWSAKREGMQIEVQYVEGISHRVAKSDPIYSYVFLLLSLVGSAIGGWAYLIQTIPLQEISIIDKGYAFREFPVLVAACLILVGVAKGSSIAEGMREMMASRSGRMFVGLFLIFGFGLVVTMLRHGFDEVTKGGVVLFVKLGTIFMSLAIFGAKLRNPGLFKRLLLAWVPAVFLAAVLGIYAVFLLYTGRANFGAEAAGGLMFYSRLTSSFSDPNGAAFYYVTSLPVLVYFYSVSDKSKMRMLLLLLIITLVILLFATGSRAGKLAIVVTFLVGLFSENSKKLYALALVSSVILLIATWSMRGLAGDIVFSNTFEESASISTTSDQKYFEDESRNDYIKWSLDDIAKTLLVGSGLGSSGTGDLPQPHNAWLAILLETGIVGFSVFLALCAGVVRDLMVLRLHSVSEIRNLASLLLAILFGSFSMMMFHGLVTGFYIWFLFFIIIAFTSAPERSIGLVDVRSRAGGRNSGRGR